MSGAIAAEILQVIPSRLLDSPVSDIHIAELASDIERWEDYAPFLGLSKPNVEEIRMDYVGRYGLQKRAALGKWKEKKGKEATYRQLITVLCCLQQGELVEKVKQLLMPDPKQEKQTTTDVLETFRNYLLDCYSQTTPPSHIQWPFHATSTYVDLPLSKVPPTLGAREQPTPPKPVQLSELFHAKAKRKVILLEGAAGCGKTSLTWHACQQWAEGKLFQNIPLLIHVSLVDPSLPSAWGLADIIPHPSGEMREAVAKAIADQHGKAVCFLFDAWDEAPPALHQPNSFLYRFITGTSGRMMLPRCSIVITSRPVAAGLLYPLLTSRVVIGRLDGSRVAQLLDANLSSEEREALLQSFEQNPQLAAFCNLPINAAIVTYLFRILGHSLPPTRTAQFKALVCNLLVRHMQLRTDHGLQAVSEFEGLPQPILEKLLFISSLAYRGIVQHMRMFSAEFLDTLGLMQVHQQLTMFGPCHQCSFLHFTVQEFLAAYHISTQSSSEQAKSISKILHRDPLSPVLPFYAGLTRLSNDGVRDVLLKVTKKPLDKLAFLNETSHALSSDRRRLALALLNCIFESQNVSMCKLPQIRKDIYGSGLHSISFSSLGLEPMDCLSIGYFMANRNLKDHCTVDMSCCGVGETEIEALISQFKPVKSSQHKHGVNFACNHLTSNAMKLIGEVLVPLVSVLLLHNCWNPAAIDIKTALKYLLEGLSRSSCRCLVLGLDSCHLTTEHVYHLVLLISCCSSIYGLNLSDNNIGGSIYMPLIATALKHNSTLAVLTLENCNIGDQELLLIGEALQTSKLGRLDICSNPFSSTALTHFLQKMCDSDSELGELEVHHPLIETQIGLMIDSNSELLTLELHRSLTEAQKRFIQRINFIRRLKNKPLFTVTDSCKKQYVTRQESCERFRSLPLHIQSRLSPVVSKTVHDHIHFCNT